MYELTVLAGFVLPAHFVASYKTTSLCTGTLVDILLGPYDIMSCRVLKLLVWIVLLMPKNILSDINMQLLATDED